MSITDPQFANLTGEVRIRAGSKFIQAPNLITAAEDMPQGVFVALSSNNTYIKASPTVAATHLVLKSGEPRLTALEIALDVEKVLTGEPVMALTGGPGTVTIPVSASVQAGAQLTVDSDGYATPRDMSAVGFVVGYANESVTLDPGDIGHIEALITLPAEYHPASS